MPTELERTHTENYLELTTPAQERINAIIGHLEGLPFTEAKKALLIVRQELEQGFTVTNG